MAWIPELQPNPNVPRNTLMEWLVRNFRRIRGWTAEHEDAGENPHTQYVKAGYGGIYLSTPVNIPGGFILPATPAKIGSGAYDSTLTSAPIAVTQNLGNASISVNETGIWMVTAAVSGEFDPITANAANTIAAAVYDETAASLADQPALFTVPRYGENFDMHFTGPVEIDSSTIDHVFSLYIWHYLGTQTINITDWIATDFHAVRVSN